MVHTRKKGRRKKNPTTKNKQTNKLTHKLLIETTLTVCVRAPLDRQRRRSFFMRSDYCRGGWVSGGAGGAGELRMRAGHNPRALQREPGEKRKGRKAENEQGTKIKSKIQQRRGLPRKFQPQFTDRTRNSSVLKKLCGTRSTVVLFLFKSITVTVLPRFILFYWCIKGPIINDSPAFCSSNFPIALIHRVSPFQPSL